MKSTSSTGLLYAIVGSSNGYSLIESTSSNGLLPIMADLNYTYLLISTYIYRLISSSLPRYNSIINPNNLLITIR